MVSSVHVCYELLLSRHMFVRANEFVRLPHSVMISKKMSLFDCLVSVTMSVSQVVSVIVSLRKAICSTLNRDTVISRELK